MAEQTNKERLEYKKHLEDETERKFKQRWPPHGPWSPGTAPHAHTRTRRELRKKEMLLKWSKKLVKSSFLIDQVTMPLVI